MQDRYTVANKLPYHNHFSVALIDKSSINFYFHYILLVFYHCCAPVSISLLPSLRLLYDGMLAEP